MTNENVDPVIKLLEDGNAYGASDESIRNNEIFNSTMNNPVAQTPRGYHQHYFQDDVSIISSASHFAQSTSSNFSRDAVFRPPKPILKEPNIKTRLFSSASSNIPRHESPISLLKTLQEESRLFLDNSSANKTPKVEEVENETPVASNSITPEDLLSKANTFVFKPASPLNNNGLLEFSPGSSATTDKMATKIALLNARNKQRSQKVTIARIAKTPLKSKIDAVKTAEKFINETDEINEIAPENALPDCTYVVNSNPGIVSSKAVPHFSGSKLYEDEKHHMVSLMEWINELLKTNINEKIEAMDFLKKSKDANKRLREMLTAASQKLMTKDRRISIGGSIFGNHRVISDLQKRARELYINSPIPEEIHKLASSNRLLVRPALKLYADVGIQTDLMQLFFAFHPIWLFIGLETVFNINLPINSIEEFTRTITDFVMKNLFFDRKIAFNKKYCQGTTKLIVNEQGTLLLHNHFLEKFCQLLFIIEQCLTERLLPNLLCMFHKSSPYKSLNDVLAFISREIMAGSTNLPKTLKSIGFVPHYKQEFFEEFDYRVRNFSSDLSDGIILGRLVDIITLPTKKDLMIVSQLRNPGGDRLRKISNVRIVLEAAKERGIDIGDIKPDLIVANDQQTLIELVWKLIGVYVAKSDIPQSIKERYEMQRLSVENFHAEIAILKIQAMCRGYLARKEVAKLKQARINNYNSEPLTVIVEVSTESQPDDKRLHQAATTIQRYWRGYLSRKEFRAKLAAVLTIQSFIRKFYATLLYRKLKQQHVLEIQQQLETNNAHKAAITIQKYWRGWLARREFYTKLRAILKIQSFVRRRNAILLSKKLKHQRKVERQIEIQQQEEMNKLHTAAITIQKYWRGLLARREFCTKLRAILKIQSLIRQHNAIHLYKKLKQQREMEHQIEIQQEEEMKKLHEAATTIQKYCRGWLARREFCTKLAAVLKIQSLVRQHNAILLSKKLRHQRQIEIQQQQEMNKFHEAATTIQKYCRGWLARREFCTKLGAVLKIQSLVRRRNAILLFKKLKHQREMVHQTEIQQQQEMKKLHSAATIIQKYWRGWLARREFCIKLRAVLKIQCFIRQSIAILLFRKLKQRHEMELLMERERIKERDELNKAATTIQKYWRGRLARKELRMKLIAILKIQSFFRRCLEHNNFLRQKRLEPENCREPVIPVSTNNRRTTNMDFLYYARRRYAQIESVTRECHHSFERARSRSRTRIPVITPVEVPLLVETTASEGVRPPLHIENIVATQKRETCQREEKAAIQIQALYRGWRVRRSTEVQILEERVEQIRLRPATKYTSIEDRRTPLSIRIDRYLNLLSSDNLWDVKVAAFNLNYISRISDDFCHLLVDLGGYERTLDCINAISNRSDSASQVVEILAEMLAYFLHNALNVRTHVERDLLKLVDICLHVGYACYKSMIITPCCISVLCDVKSYEGFVDTMTECKVKWYYGKLEERFRTLPSSDQRVQALKKFRTLLTEVGILDDPQNITTTSTKTDTYHSAKKKNPLKFPRK